MFSREKEEVESGNVIEVPLLNGEQRQQYSDYLMTKSENQRKRKRTGSGGAILEAKSAKMAKTSTNEIACFESVELNHQMYDKVDEDSDEEFTLKDVDTERAVGSILDAATSNDEDDDDEVDDVLQQMGAGEEDDVVAAAFGTDSVQNAINSILDTLPQGDRIETPDINNITGLFDSIDDDSGNGAGQQERCDPLTEAAVNSIPQF